MSRSKLTLAAALLAAMGASALLGTAPAHALDLDDLADLAEDMPIIRSIVPLPVPPRPVIIIPIDIDD